MRLGRKCVLRDFKEVSPLPPKALENNEFMLANIPALIDFQKCLRLIQSIWSQFRLEFYCLID